MFTRCRNCRRRLGLKIFPRRVVWCPHCECLLDPEVVHLGPPGMLVLDNETVYSHREPLAKAAAMFVTLALRSGASELKLEPDGENYRLSVMIGQDSYHLLPPPSHWRRKLPQVFRAIARMKPTSVGSLSTQLFATTPETGEKKWIVNISIIPQAQGEAIIVELPEWRDPNRNMLDELLANGISP